jgi:hypothetical protein
MSGADHLLNLTLENGWRVIRHLARNPNGTGGTFSQSYMVEKNGRYGFLKAFDFAEAFEPGRDCGFRFIRPCIPTRSRPLIPI